MFLIRNSSYMGKVHPVLKRLEPMAASRLHSSGTWPDGLPGVKKIKNSHELEKKAGEKFKSWIKLLAYTDKISNKCLKGW